MYSVEHPLFDSTLRTQDDTCIAYYGSFQSSSHQTYVKKYLFILPLAT